MEAIRKNEEARVAVLIPCYNEEMTIGKVIDDFRRALPTADLYVFDNNSTDATASIARQRNAIVCQEPRQGKGNVIRAMFEEVDADVYVLVDGDDTYPAEAAPELVSKILQGYDMASGDRLSSTYFQENKRPLHGLGNRLVRSSINLLFGAHLTDVMTGFRAVSFAFAKTCPVTSSGFEVETEMTIHSLDNNLRICEIPIQYRCRPNGSVSKLDTFGDGIKVMSTIFRMIREYRPLPFFGLSGLLISMVGLVLTLSVMIDYWKTGVVLRFPTLIGSVMLVIAGLLLIVAGIILDIMAAEERKRIILARNQFAYLSRQQAASTRPDRPCRQRIPAADPNRAGSSPDRQSSGDSPTEASQFC